MFELKTLSKEAIPKALEKAERYRLLNEPSACESICLDILQVDPENQVALVTLLLARTDQFEHSLGAVQEAREVLPRLRGEYEQSYYAGLICERRAKAQIEHGGRGSEWVAYESLREAMGWYERAGDVRPVGNDDALLRWNACARLIMGNPRLRPAPADRTEPPLE